jgi:hypothetical protein
MSAHDTQCETRAMRVDMKYLGISNEDQANHLPLRGPPKLRAAIRSNRQNYPRFEARLIARVCPVMRAQLYGQPSNGS